jgi:hypothetical protein
MAASTQPSKDTVYVDVDDEITSIIDKVRAGDGRIVALVLPKRAAVLQSVVNMKLLKRSAEQAKKQLVLITTEAGLLPLAGAVGIHVADTLQSKPEIPTAPVSGAASQLPEESLSLEDEPEEEFTADNAGDKPVGELASKSGKGLVITSGVETETPVAPVVGAAAAGAATGAAKKPNKKLMVPNFNKFRLRLVLLGAGLLALIVLGYLAFMVLPKATVAISTNAEDVNSNLGFSLDTTAADLDLNKSNIPGTAVQQQKTYTQQVDATGKLNNGKIAQGSATFSICMPPFVDPDDIPAGTGISASNGNRYTLQEKARFPNNGSPDYAHSCYRFTSNTVNITATAGGASYNVDSATFDVDNSSATGTGSASGGTDDITIVVSQADIDNAKGKIKTEDAAIKDALYQQLSQDGLFGIRSTFQASDPTVSSSSQPGDKASTVTVTESVTYTMFGTPKKYLVELIKDDIGQQVDLDKQAVLNDGLDKATFTVDDISDTVARINLENTATVGPKIDKAAIAKQIAGMKSGEAKDMISQLPGVSGVDIKLGPFWVSSIPKNTDKIVITVGKAAADN